MKNKNYNNVILLPKYITLLRRVQAQLRRRHGQFYMGKWFINKENVSPLFRPSINVNAIPDCGTACCICGWMYSIDQTPAKKKIKLSEHEKNRNKFAVTIKEYTKEQPQLKKLFYTNNWPLKFQTADCLTDEENAIKRIEHFIATDGKE